MSWSVDKKTMAVTMHKGDTGAYYVTLTRGSGLPFEDGDTAIYEVKQGDTVKIHREFNLQPAEPNDIELGDGKFLIAFRNSDTDTWAATTYNTEIRSAIRPKRKTKTYLTVTAAEREPGTDPITATIDEDACLAFVDTDTGTITLEFSTSWSEAPTDYGITVTGTPIAGDKLTVSWDKNGDGSVADGNNIRTLVKSTVTIQDVLINI